MRACRIAQADRLVERFPDGLDAELAERGANLSHGERQLVSMARALVHDPDLLVLDEATSSVDPHTEARIQEALEHLLQGRTALIVAHRLSTIHNAEGRLGDALARQLERRSEAELRLARLWVLFSIFFQALNWVGQLVAVVIGGLWVIEGRLSLGAFFSFYLYLGLLLGPMMDLPNLFVTARQAFVCMERLDEVAAFDPERELDANRGHGRRRHPPGRYGAPHAARCDPRRRTGGPRHPRADMICLPLAGRRPIGEDWLRSKARRGGGIHVRRSG